MPKTKRKPKTRVRSSELVSLCGVLMSEDAKRTLLRLHMTCANVDIADLLTAFQIGRISSQIRTG